jgi:fumarate reductase subunit D
MGHQPIGSAMRTTSPAAPSNRVAVTVLGLITLLLGGAYAALGGQLILAGASWAGQSGGDPWGPVATLFGILPALLIAVGVAFLPLGLLGLLAGAGVLLRKPWGRILTFILAVLAIQLGLVWVGGGDQDATDIVLGAAQVFYGILAFVILIGNGAAFFRARG